MRDLGEGCGANRVARLMRAEGLRAQRGYGRRPGKHGGKPAAVAPNHLQRRSSLAQSLPEADGPSTVTQGVAVSASAAKRPSFGLSCPGPPDKRGPRRRRGFGFRGPAGHAAPVPPPHKPAIVRSWGHDAPCCREWPATLDRWRSTLDSPRGRATHARSAFAVLY